MSIAWTKKEGSSLQWLALAPFSQVLSPLKTRFLPCSTLQVAFKPLLKVWPLSVCSVPLGFLWVFPCGSHRSGLSPVVFLDPLPFWCVSQTQRSPLAIWRSHIDSSWAGPLVLPLTGIPQDYMSYRQNARVPQSLCSLGMCTQIPQSLSFKGIACCTKTSICLGYQCWGGGRKKSWSQAAINEFWGSLRD